MLYKFDSPLFFRILHRSEVGGGLNVIIKVRIVKILANFKHKELGNHKSKVYERTYQSKESFMV